MENLKLCSEISVKLQWKNEDDERLLFPAIDVEGSRMFFASSNNRIYSVPLPAHLNGKVRGSDLTLESLEPLQLEMEEFITAFDYLMEKESLVIGTSTGLIMLYAVEDKSTEIIGRADGGVTSISPSPDGDHLAVATGTGQLLVMTRDWDALYETKFEDCPDVAIGCSGESIQKIGFSHANPISWRGDGKYLATLSKLPDSSLHQIKVWERDSGVLHSASEQRKFIPSVLDWMPSGEKIATVYELKEEKKCPSIVFFERNGLERSSFSINETVDATIEILKWNCSSDLLAGVVRCEKYDCVKVWVLSNNHWYLKQEIRYLRQDGVRIMWHPIQPLQLICWTPGGHLSVYDFIWVTAIMENSVAFVVDHCSVFVTPLSFSLIPPPMCSFRLNFSCTVREIAFYPSKLKSLLAAYLSDGCLSILELPSVDIWEDLEGKEFEVETTSFKAEFGSLLHLTWLNSHILLGASHLGSNYRGSLSHYRSLEDELGCHLFEIEAVCFDIDVPGQLKCSRWHAESINQIFVKGFVMCIARNPVNQCSAFVELDRGDIFEYISCPGTHGAISAPSFHKHDMRFSFSCPWMTVAAVDTAGQLKPLLTGLDEHGRLHVDGRILCSNCNSFSMYSSSSDRSVTHLILATKQDLLYVIDIADVVEGKAEIKYDNFIHVANKKRREESSKFINLWERGAEVVGVLHGDEAAVVLQTSRGNLECVYPRKLVLACTVNALDQSRFRDALLMVRRHRIDFNVIVDYFGWQAFIPFSSDFVRQVNDLRHITEFVSAIKNENTAERLYENYISFPHSKEEINLHDKDGKGLGSEGKVSSVLSAIRKSVEAEMPESPARELCILTTLARSDPPALEEALKRIKVTREMELSGTNDPRRRSYPSAEEALKHLLWLSDHSAVFQAALGLYDLNIAAIVALNAEKDPKEFLPFLQELEQLPALTMQYKIDLHLHRYEKALEHIVSAGYACHSELMTLLRNHPQLFPLGLRLVNDPSKKREVYEAWGDHFVDLKCFEDAATAFLCCGNLNKASKAYRAYGDWRGVLTVSGLLKLGKEEVLQLAHELAEELQALGRPSEAARVALEYCGDVNSAISLFMSAREWDEALRIAFMSRNDDLISEVRHASSECAGVLTCEFEDGLEKIRKYTTRYLAVRQRRLLLAAKLQSEDSPLNDIDDDTVSEASSNFSGMSAYTMRTKYSSVVSVGTSAASNRRENRRQRNRGKIRAGSPGEEIALVEHLKSMSLTSSAKRELQSLLTVLLMLGMGEIARKLQSLAETFHLSQIASVKLAEVTMATDVIDEYAFTLEHYIQKAKGEMQNSEGFSWRSKVLLSH